MSILDGLPRNRKEATEVFVVASAVLGNALAKADLNPRDRSIVDLLGQGLSLADICKITREERDALFARGCQLLQVGDVAGAQDMLMGLFRLEPMDERVMYVLGITHQLQGNYPVAGKLFAQAIALDAGNQNYYLRLGECLLANREFEIARGCFEAARIDLGGGPPSPAIRAHADRMLEMVNTQAAS